MADAVACRVDPAAFGKLGSSGTLRRRNVNDNASTVGWYFAAAGARWEARAAEPNSGCVDIDAMACSTRPLTTIASDTEYAIQRRDSFRRDSLALRAPRAVGAERDSSMTRLTGRSVATTMSWSWFMMAQGRWMEPCLPAT